MELLEPLPGDVRVNLRCRNIGVAQKQLQHPQIGTMIEQMGGKRMAQGVGRQDFPGDRNFCVTLQQVPESLSGHACATRGHKQEITRSSGKND